MGLVFDSTGCGGVSLRGIAAREEVLLWLVSPDGEVVHVGRYRADDNGEVQGELAITDVLSKRLVAGEWTARWTTPARHVVAE